MPSDEQAKHLLQGIVKAKVIRDNVKVQPSFTMALSNYAYMLGKSEEVELQKSDSIAFVLATVSAKALKLAQGKKAKSLDANLLYEALDLIKFPPRDPMDPCIGAAHHILTKRNAGSKSEVAVTVDEILTDLV